MSDANSTAQTVPGLTPPELPAVTASVMRRLSTLDRFLPLWILSAMLLGLMLADAKVAVATFDPAIAGKVPGTPCPLA